MSTTYRDGVYRQETEDEWKTKLRTLHEKNAARAEIRIRAILNGRPWDWDDNVEEDWAIELAKELCVQ